MDVTIEGDSDLILNKMNDVTMRKLVGERKNKAKDLDVPNVWEEIITSMHWRDGKPTDFSEDGLKKALQENAPCISTFGLLKSFGSAVLDTGIDNKTAKKFFANVNIIANGNITPITFAEHFIDEKLMQPKKGSPVLVRLNRFSGWSTTFTLKYMETIYSTEQIVNIICLAGFSGIGSGRSSGYGRYHISKIS